MKAQILTLLSLTLLSSIALADSTMQKPVTRIDFNKMIDEGQSRESELQKSVSHKVAKKALVKRIKSDKIKVLDFIDVEMNLGENRPVVDRRFNSIGAAKIVQVDQLKVQVLPKNGARKGS